MDLKKLRIALSILLAVGMIAGLAGVLRQRADQTQGAAEYAAAQEIASVAAPTPANTEEIPGAPDIPEEPTGEPDGEEPAGIDLAALQAVNPEVIGWIAIPGTELSYPVVQGTDNDYYLAHTWNRESSSVGAVFLDYRSDAGLTDFNSLLYGHRMRNGSMFGSLKHYKNQSYYEQAPTVLLTDAEGPHRYDIFAAYQAKVDAALYLPGGDDRAQAEEVLRFAAEHNVLETGLSPTPEDQILTLITCTGTGYSARWIVQAVLTADT